MQHVNIRIGRGPRSVHRERGRERTRCESCVQSCAFTAYKNTNSLCVQDKALSASQKSAYVRFLKKGRECTLGDPKESLSVLPFLPYCDLPIEKREGKQHLAPTTTSCQRRRKSPLICTYGQVTIPVGRSATEIRKKNY